MARVGDTLQRVIASASAGRPREGYAGAAALSVAVLALMALLRVGTDATVFSPLLAAVAVSAVLWGVRPGVLSLLIGAVGSMGLVVEPTLSFRLGNSRDLAGLVAFITLGALLVVFGGMYRATLRRLDELRSEREAEVGRRLEEQRAIADALQTWLLPAAIAPPAWLRVAVRYRAGREALTVGGDFYDAFPGGGGFLLVVGDVCGKGPEAAALTSVARHTIRATAAAGGDLPECLRAVNRRVREEQRRPSEFLTLVMCEARPAPGGVLVRCAAAGHPPPLVVRDRCVTAVAAHGELLGVFPEPRFTLDEVLLGPGDRLVLYTDGVTEARLPGGQLGQAGLSWLLGEAGDVDEQGVADRLLDAVVAANDGARGDDVALLVAGVPVTPPGGTPPAGR